MSTCPPTNVCRSTSSSGMVSPRRRWPAAWVGTGPPSAGSSVATPFPLATSRTWHNGGTGLGASGVDQERAWPTVTCGGRSSCCCNRAGLPSRSPVDCVCTRVAPGSTPRPSTVSSTSRLWAVRRSSTSTCAGARRSAVDAKAAGCIPAPLPTAGSSRLGHGRPMSVPRSVTGRRTRCSSHVSRLSTFWLSVSAASPCLLAWQANQLETPARCSSSASVRCHAEVSPPTTAARMLTTATSPANWPSLSSSAIRITPGRRARVENTNGLVRRYLPRDTELNRVAPEDLDAIAGELNHRPRKCLAFLTPAEVLFGHSVALRR